MTVADIQSLVMFQTNNDIDDMEDYLPHLLDYVNEGYDLLVHAWAEVHPTDAENDDGEVPYPTLKVDTDEPPLPLWTHKAIADWATWCCYRNGNAAKQQRGMAFRSAFEEVIARIRSEGGAHGKVKHFINIPR